MSKAEYIEKFSEEAIREMHASGIPASITLAQGILESDCGNSPLAKYANNHFGIKCHKGWDGPTFIQDDDEKNECFRKYYHPTESYRDHSQFLTSRDRYKGLFELKTTDYKGWATGLREAGYATNPKYADLLIRIIEENNLMAYDQSMERVERPVAKSARDDRHQVAPILSVRQVEVSENRIRYVIARKGDTPESIARQQNMGVWQIRQYNDLSKTHYFLDGEIVYLQPKRSRATVEKHTVQNGETLRDVSQKYGIKMKRILKLNDLPANYMPKDGVVLRLR